MWDITQIKNFIAGDIKTLLAHGFWWLELTDLLERLPELQQREMIMLEMTHMLKML